MIFISYITINRAELVFYDIGKKWANLLQYMYISTPEIYSKEKLLIYS